MSLWFKRPTLRCKSKESILALQFSPDDRQIAVGCFDGSVTIYDTTSCMSIAEFKITRANKHDEAALPCTSIRFHPSSPVLLVCASDGTVQKRDVRTLEVLWLVMEEGNEVYCCDYRKDGTQFATGGCDGSIRVYTDATNTLLRLYHTHSEHSVNRQALRLYSVVFSQDDQTKLFACGWSSTIHVMNTTEPEIDRNNELFGPYMIGDALDVRGDTLLAGCNKLEARVMFYNVNPALLPGTEMKWPTAHNFSPLCAKFSKDQHGDFIAVGGGGCNGLIDAAFVLEQKTGKCVVDAKFEGSVNVCSFGWKDARIAFGDSVGCIHVFEKASKK